MASPDSWLKAESTATRSNDGPETSSYILPRLNHRQFHMPHRPRPSIESRDGSEYEALGNGGFGRCIKAKSSLSRKLTVVKTIPQLANTVSELKQKIGDAMIELRTIANLPPHPNIVRYLASTAMYGLPRDVDFSDLQPEKYKYKHCITIEMEYCPEGSLHKFLLPVTQEEDKEERATRLLQSVDLCLDLILGLSFLHELNLVHRDIKPYNVFLEYDFKGNLRAKIGDYGLSCWLGNRPLLAGTKGFSAPEQSSQLEGSNGRRKDPATDADKASDIFSAGITCAAVLYEEPHPIKFEGRLSLTPDEFAGTWDYGAGDLPWDLKRELGQLIQDMTAEDPATRPAIDEVKYRVFDLRDRLEDALYQAPARLRDEDGIEEPASDLAQCGEWLVSLSKEQMASIESTDLGKELGKLLKDMQSANQNED